MDIIDNIRADIKSKVKVGVSMWADEVSDTAESTMQKFYNEYSPKKYVRTHTVQDSLTKDVGDNFADVYFDIGEQRHYSGNWDEKKIQDSVMSWGTHGGAKSGTPVWTTSMEKIGDPEYKLIKCLKKAGL